MTLSDRVAVFKAAYGKWPACWPQIVREQGRDVLYATWLIGNDYRASRKFYGQYPPGYLERVMAFFPDVPIQARSSYRAILHAFSGSLPAGDYTRCDLRQDADLPCSVYDIYDNTMDDFALVLADPPYSAADAAKYETAMVDRRRAMAALAQVTRVGGHLVWLDTVWPMHRKAEWLTVGRITVVRSTNHRVRMATIFERAA